MSINAHDDYEELAKLLYPSIESSGNVYYGQTRRLTLDKIFDKDKDGFKCYFDSYRHYYVEDKTKYTFQRCLCWKLGPLNDIIDFSNNNIYYDDIPLVYFRYKINIEDKQVSNVINSGNYITYEKQLTIGEPTAIANYFLESPDGKELYDGRNFYIQYTDGTPYLYIAVSKFKQSINLPLYLEVTNDVSAEVFICDNSDEEGLPPGLFEYSEDNINWKPLVLQGNTHSNIITIEPYKRCYFRCVGQKLVLSTSYYFSFRIRKHKDETSGNIPEVTVGGNLISMASNKDSLQPNEFFRLFMQNECITNAEYLYIGKTANYSCGSLFTVCNNLVYPPKVLPCKELVRGCYANMFNGCNLRTDYKLTTILPADILEPFCYNSMFGETGCRSLVCLGFNISDPGAINYILRNAGSEGTLYVNPESIEFWEEKLDDVIVPSDWKIEPFTSNNTEYEAKSLKNILCKDENIVAHGTDNIYNGGGRLINLEYKTYEEKFDEKQIHKADTYNEDGSLNQDIWGYKTFNSPVQFRNGVYTEYGSLADYYKGRISYYGPNSSRVEYKEKGINLYKSEKLIYNDYYSEATSNIRVTSTDSTGIYTSTDEETGEEAENIVIKYCNPKAHIYAEEKEYKSNGLGISTLEYDKNSSITVETHSENYNIEPAITISSFQHNYKANIKSTSEIVITPEYININSKNIYVNGVKQNQPVYTDVDDTKKISVGAFALCARTGNATQSEPDIKIMSGDIGDIIDTADSETYKGGNIIWYALFDGDKQSWSLGEQIDYGKWTIVSPYKKTISTVESRPVVFLAVRIE